MDHALAEQLRYYEGARRAAARRPGLHRALIGALDAHLALAERSADAATFSAALAHGGHATALARAGQLDRLAADLALARAIGDPLAARTAARGLEAFAPEGDAAFVDGYRRLAEAGAAGFPAAAGEHAAMLVVAAIDLKCDPEPARHEDHRRRARTAWTMLRVFLPGFGLGWLTAPPVCHALPFAPHAGAALRELIAEALDHPADLDGAPVPAILDPGPMPAVDAIAAIAPTGWPPAPGFDGQTIIARMAAIDAGDDDAAAPRDAATALLRAQRDVALARDEVALARLADELVPAIAAATTGTEVAAWCGWHGAVSSLERWWWTVLAQIGLWPAVAALIAPEACRPAAVLAARLLGVDPRRALRAPAIARPLRRQVVHAGWLLDDELPIAGPGAGLVEYLRVAAAAHATAAINAAADADAEIPDFVAAARRFTDEAPLLAAVDAALDAVGAPTGGDGVVMMWGAELALDDVDPARSTFARPRPEALW